MGFKAECRNANAQKKRTGTAIGNVQLEGPVLGVSHLRFDSSSFAVSNLAFVNVPEPAKISNPNCSYANFSNFSLFCAGTGSGTFTNLTTKHKRQIQK